MIEAIAILTGSEDVYICIYVIIYIYIYNQTQQNQNRNQTGDLLLENHVIQDVKN